MILCFYYTRCRVALQCAVCIKLGALSPYRYFSLVSQTSDAQPCQHPSQRCTLSLVTRFRSSQHVTDPSCACKNTCKISIFLLLNCISLKQQTSTRILFLEILPNCTPALMAQLTLDIGYVILDLAAMSFIGLGVQPPTADWVTMLEEGRVMLFGNPILSIMPGLAIIITVIAINIYGRI